MNSDSCDRDRTSLLEGESVEEILPLDYSGIQTLEDRRAYVSIPVQFEKSLCTSVEMASLSSNSNQPLACQWYEQWLCQ